MSYDVSFMKDDAVCTLPFAPPAGGTYCLDSGFHRAWLNITYNYGPVYARYGFSISHKDNLKSLEGATAGCVVQMLAEFIPKLGGDVSENYWEPTEGNAKKALVDLLVIAVSVPQDAVCAVG